MSTAGIGLTVIVNILLVLLQLFAIPITEIIAVTGYILLLVAIKDDMFPVPFAGNPISEAELIQLNVVPETDPIKPIGSKRVPLQTTIFEG